MSMLLNPMFMKGVIMARAQRYTVDTTTKEIKAIVGELSEKELQAVNNFMALGFTLVPVEAPKKEKSNKGVFTKAQILKYIKENKLDFDFEALMKEPCENPKPTKRKRKVPPTKGYVYALKEFRDKYEDDYKKWLEAK